MELQPTISFLLFVCNNSKQERFKTHVFLVRFHVGMPGRRLSLAFLQRMGFFCRDDTSIVFKL